jgi:uncharacterized protein (TIGR02680 family)
MRAVEPLRLPRPDRERWTPLRAGIQNVWEYDRRVFVFHRGRLLLRGRNEAGKTKALELLFPFLLDADLSPGRLDPFGSTARPMRWNLLNDENPEDQIRIGYVWLEFGRVDGGEVRHLAIGAGLKARRSASDVEPWFFITSLRPEEDLRLFGDDGRPLTRGELAEALGDSGQVFESRGEYRRALNARLFGMADDQYDALIDMLLHLRRPHLSKSLEVDPLSAFLSASLPPLDSRVIGPIAEGFERLDHRRADLENLRAVLGTLRAFHDVYREYARAIAKGHASAVVRAEGAYAKARAEAKHRTEEREALAGRVAEVEAQITHLADEERSASARLRALELSDEWRAARDLAEAEAQAAAAGHRLEAARERASDDVRLSTLAEARLATAKEEAAAAVAALERARAEARSRAAEAALDADHPAFDALTAAGEVDAAATVREEIARRRAERIACLKDLVRALERADAQHRRAEERVGERNVDVRDAREALHAAERQSAAALGRLDNAIAAWRRGLEVLAVGEDLGEPTDVREVVERVAAPIRDALASERAAADAEASVVGRDRDAVAAEREALLRAPHPLPTPPGWRAPRAADRAGAPLYTVCDFGEGSRGREAAIEGALEAAGLLDAWVEPDGAIRDPLAQDAVIRSRASLGRTLADVLVPVAAGSVSAEAARAALASVGFAEPGEEPDGECWVAADGRFRLGALEGANRKTAAAYVGASARAAERARRLADLDSRIALLDARIGEAAARSKAACGRAEQLARELAAVPRPEEVLTARAAVDAQAKVLEAARAQLAVAERAAADAGAARTRAAAALDGAAGEMGLAAWSRDPAALEERTRAWEAATVRLLDACGTHSRSAANVHREESAARDAVERARRAGEEREAARGESVKLQGHADALRAAVGAEACRVVEEAARARTAIEAAVNGGRDAQKAKGGVDQDLGAARLAATAAEVAVAARDSDRKSAAESLGALAADGLLEAAALYVGSMPTGSLSFTAALELARRVDGLVQSGATEEERGRAEDRLVRRHGELQAQLPPDVRILATRPRNVLVYEFAMNGRNGLAREVLAQLEAQVEARGALLADDERKLIEEFLSGEAHDHLADRLRRARGLVDRMNAALEGRTTASGTAVRLQWELDSEHAGERAAVPLFLRAGHLLTEPQRDTLRLFLHSRLAEARDGEGPKPLQSRLLDSLDYRPWHRFVVQQREPGRDWATLTRKAHAAGSGGKKAVLLHLPLFAAAAAFFDSARPEAPRVVALDEAFAGIDRQMRGGLMGLLAEFDLDFVMTSFEEWGFYEELDGLSAYHLSRDPAVRGVHAEWFVWDGRERVLVEEP